MRRAVLMLLVPPVSVVVAMAVRCLICCVVQLVPSGSSFRYPSPARAVEKQGGELPVVALMYKNKKRSHSVDGEEQEEYCVLCLSGIEEGSEVRDLKCRHLFHRGCLDRWLLLAATCPLCRCRLLLAAWEDDDEDLDSDLMLFMACVHSRSTWLWPS